MSDQLLLVTIGPVQDFIAAARRCQDFWYGSWLLSELGKAAAAGIVDALGGAAAIDCLIFPGALARKSLEPGSDNAAANRLLARIPGDGARARAAAEAGQRALQERLQELRQAAFAQVGRGDPERVRHFHEQVAEAQVDALIEYCWVSVPERPGDDRYARARTEAERLMAARKNTKLWSQPAWAKAGVPKSSLDGVRESVLDESLFDTPRGERLRRSYGVHGSERLCGVGLLKRHGVPAEDGARQRFPSTSHVAALPFMIGVERDEQQRGGELAAEWARFTAALADCGALADLPESTRRRSFFGRIDGAVLFPMRLQEELEELGLQTAYEQVHGAYRRFLRCARRGEPVPYYAILLGDGDKMGAVIDAQRTFASHRELSLALDGFARQAEAVVEQCHGGLIYSGGDDVLALVPLHTAVACAARLAETFREALDGWQAEDGDAPTLSVGLAVAHHLMPLDEALALARRAERTAKDDAGRNALAVIVKKRGGAAVSVHGKWEVDAGLVARLEMLATLHRLEAVPDRAGYELAGLARLLEHVEPGEDRKAMRAIQISEAKRILGRKRACHGREALAKETLEELGKMLRGDGQDNPAEALGRELYVAALLARAAEQAGEEVTS
ncbi:MAG: type III-B CRISPR-associated protein Cas10/Cmr2 [Candidatus Schekmanbacteria bacterium]|nr:type III-B CRISPR-associated protein Cas10/Cmr2 [Candidatus Schekmanbacteria bacterium]